MSAPAIVRPSIPVRRAKPPTGPQWLHEVKFDGWRGQLHRHGREAIVYSRNGHDVSRRFALIRDAVLALPCRSAVLDAELLVIDAEGRPDFHALMAGEKANVAVVFDVMHIAGVDLRARPLAQRRTRLQRLLERAASPVLTFSEAFDDAHALLAQCDARGLEGIVSKRTDQRYVSGPNPGWIKVKTAAWLTASRERREMFEKRGR